MAMGLSIVRRGGTAWGAPQGSRGVKGSGGYFSMRCNPSRWLWGLIPVAMLSWGAFQRERLAIEADVAERAARALTADGQKWASVVFDGRDAIITGRARKDGEPKAALDAVRGVWGVRKVELRTDLAATPHLKPAIGPLASEESAAKARAAAAKAREEEARRAKAEAEAEAAAAAEKARREAEAAAAAEAARKEAEVAAAADRARKEAEAKAAAETAKRDAEAAAAADQARKSGEVADEAKKEAEAAAAADKARKEAEAKAAAETAKRDAEARAAAEQAKKKSADAAAAAAETAKKEAEVAAAADRARKEAEARAAAETAKRDAEARVAAAADKAKKEAEAAAAEKARKEAEAKAGAEKAKRDAEARAAAAEKAKQDALAKAKKEADVAAAAAAKVAHLSRGTNNETRACEQRLTDAAKNGTILFERAKADIDPASSLTIARIAEIVKSCPGTRIEVEGHTDSEGEPERNQNLSERRARAVVRSLEFAGLPASRLTAVGFGAGRPIAANDTPENMAKNRRIEFRVYTK